MRVIQPLSLKKSIRILLPSMEIMTHYVIQTGYASIVVSSEICHNMTVSTHIDHK